MSPNPGDTQTCSGAVLGLSVGDVPANGANCLLDYIQMTSLFLLVLM